VSNPWVGDRDPAASAERARAYAARFDRLAAEGADPHGEADLVAALVPAGALILDAGCGTGRVAARLTDQGYRTVGVDVDAGMIGQARRRHPLLAWIEGDLADLVPRRFSGVLGSGITVLDRSAPFDAVVAAGNVMPLLTPGTELAAIQALAALLKPDGLLIAGFGLDDAHLPPVAPATAAFRSLLAYDAACSSTGLRLQDRWATWDRAPFDDTGYAVSVHRLAALSG
jgi:SAM-dependent methyltransferase